MKIKVEMEIPDSVITNLYAEIAAEYLEGNFLKGFLSVKTDAKKIAEGMSIANKKFKGNDIDEIMIQFKEELRLYVRNMTEKYMAFRSCP